jgi:hypothetical protein
LIGKYYIEKELSNTKKKDEINRWTKYYH